MMPPEETPMLLLPAGIRLVHIGPPKTGTTSLQSAFHAGREEIEAQNVRYAGPTSHPAGPVRAVLGLRSPSAGVPPPIRAWRNLVREVKRAHDSRVVISSEFFADARSDHVRTIVNDLDPARVHIAVTLRPLARIMPSQWQQYVQSGFRSAFDVWLDAMLRQSDSEVTPTFWRRHRHDQLVARWADVVGPENVTVVALDDRDHTVVLRVFEQLVGLRDGTLVDDEDLGNRSMTLPEIEVVRAFNESFLAEGLPRPLHAKVMNFGAAAYMKKRAPRPDEPRVEMPPWALDRTAQIAREMVDNIVASGVRIVGDPEGLTQLGTSGSADGGGAPAQVSPEIAASAAMGVLIASGLARGRSEQGWDAMDVPWDLGHDPAAFIPKPSIERLELVRVSTHELTGVLARRILQAVSRRRHVVRRKLG